MKLQPLLLAPLLVAALPQQSSSVRTYDTRNIVERVGSKVAAPQLGRPRPLQSNAMENAGPQDGNAKPEEADDSWRERAKSLEEILRRQLQLDASASSESHWLHVSADGVVSTRRDVSRLHMNERGSLSANLEEVEHSRLVELLERLRSFVDLVSFEVRLVEVPKAVAAKLGIEGDSMLTSTEDRDVLLASLRAEGMNLLVAPKLAMRSLQAASLQVGESLNYIHDWSVTKVEPGAVEVLDPLVMEVQLGTYVQARAVPLPDGKLSLSVEIQYATMERPLRTQRVQLGSREVEVALPEISAQRVQVELTVAPKATTLLPIPSEADKLLLVFVTADVVPETK